MARIDDWATGLGLASCAQPPSTPLHPQDEGMADRAPLGDLVDACCGTLAEAPPGFVTAERPLLGP